MRVSSGAGQAMEQQAAFEMSVTAAELVGMADHAHGLAIEARVKNVGRQNDVVAGDFWEAVEADAQLAVAIHFQREHFARERQGPGVDQHCQRAPKSSAASRVAAP